MQQVSQSKVGSSCILSILWGSYETLMRFCFWGVRSSCLHGVNMSFRSLKRRWFISQKGVSSTDVIIRPIRHELRGPGQLWRVLRQWYNLPVRRDHVMTLLIPHGCVRRAEEEHTTPWDRTIYGRWMVQINSNHSVWLFQGVLMDFPLKYCGFNMEQQIVTHL